MEPYNPLAAWSNPWRDTTKSRRAFVEYLANKMEETLRRNDTKPAWELETMLEVLNKLQEELHEFLDAISTGKAEDIEAEGIDVMIMIGATMAKFVPIMCKWRRGREE